MSDVKLRPPSDTVNNSDFIVLQEGAAPLGVEKRVRVGSISKVYGREQVKNIYPISSEQLVRSQSNTGGALDNQPLPNAPFGIRSGSRTSAGAGFNQSNISIPVDNDWYIFSFIDYVGPGTTSAKTRLPSVGVFGVENIGFTYDFDNPLTASPEVFNNSVVANLANVWRVQDLGGGYTRFSRAFKNNGTGGLFIIRFDSSIDFDKVIHSGFMLEKRPQDCESLLPSDYVPTNTVAPHLGMGIRGQNYLLNKKLPFKTSIGFSDSILGSGTNAKLAMLIPKIAGRGYVSTVGGTRLFETNASGTPVLGRFYQDIANTSGALVIFCGGRNDVGSLTADYRSRMTDELKSAVSALGHDNYLVMGVLCRWASTGAAGTEETALVNASTYNSIIALNRLWQDEFGLRFVDVQRALVDSYNPLSVADVNAFAIGMRPPSLTGTTAADNLHPVDAETQVMFAAINRALDAIY